MTHTWLIKRFSRKDCVDVCTDGAQQTMGRTCGFTAHVRAIAPDCTHRHCITHRYFLAVKRFRTLWKLFDKTVKIANFIKWRPLNPRTLSALPDEMGGRYRTLLLHTEVQWLSRGNTAVRIFFVHHPVQFSSCLRDLLWLQRLPYLPDTFCNVYELNLTLQGTTVTTISAHNKVDSFIRKIQFLRTCVEKVTKCSPTSNDVLATLKTQPNVDVRSDITHHSQSLLVTVTDCFPPTVVDIQGAHNPLWCLCYYRD
jgi:hypothetical protein